MVEMVTFCCLLTLYCQRLICFEVKLEEDKNPMFWDEENLDLLF